MAKRVCVSFAAESGLCRRETGAEQVPCRRLLFFSCIKQQTALGIGKKRPSGGPKCKPSTTPAYGITGSIGACMLGAAPLAPFE